MRRYPWRRADASALLAPGGSARPKRRWLGKHRRLITITLVTLLAAGCVATGRLFIWPAQGMPARVSAIVMLNGPGDRLSTALRLAWQQRAPFLVVSRGSSVYGHGSGCAPQIPHVHVICFDPSPATTRGEAEFVGRLARKYHWQSIALVTITPQDSRARLRVERCFNGSVYVVTASLPLWEWPYEIAYEWGALGKALVLQSSC